MGLFRDPNIHPISDLASKGKGFVVNGNKFVHHTNLHHKDSAVISITAKQKTILFVSAIVVGLLLLLSWRATLQVLIVVITIFYFADLLFGLFLAYRSFTKNPEVAISEEELKALKAKDLPRYTIFCPLYKEWQVLPQFVRAISELEYPKSKLQVMLQLEEDDTETIAKAMAMDLPTYFHIVVVPHSKPKTKPKAMNYGLQFATGDIITIYDAEDVPEPEQLKKAVAAFKKLPENVVCVQGKLNFYNRHQNMLTRMFTAEYSLWFDLILPGLQSIKAPIPLGGTSNHFKKSMLHELAGWDAYNVTEDCDLGLRLAKRGFTTAIIDSVTLEEANSGYHNWYRQRSRWIKGYMQTYLVHMRQPRESVKEFGAKNLLLLQLTVGGKILSMFVNPLLWLVTIIYFAFRTQAAPYIEPFFPPLVLYFGVTSLIFGNFFYVYAYLIGLAKRREFSVMKYVIFVPLYWLGMSVAAWKAFYELIVKPHYWQKTVHGLHLGGNKKAEEQSSKNIAAGQIIRPGLVMQNRRRVVKKVTPNVAIPIPQPIMASAAMERAEQPLPTKKIPVPPTPEPPIPDLPIPDSKPNIVEKILQQLGLEGLSKGIWLIAAMMFANVLNFVFSAILGRKLAPEHFGTITLFNTIILLFGIVTGPLSGSVTYRIARLLGSKHPRMMGEFMRKTGKWSGLTGLVITIVWVLASPAIARFFQISDSYLVFALAPIFPVMISQGIWSGFLRGDFAFRLLAVGVLADPVVKLGIAGIFIAIGRSDLMPLALILAVTAGWFTLFILGRKVLATQKAIEDTSRDPVSLTFPKQFFSSAVIATAAGTLFLTADVLLVKHYFEPGLAGSYALLSLCGNMIFYLCGLPGVFITTIVSRERGAGRSGREAFMPIFRLVIFTALCGFTFVGAYGQYTIPFLFGDHTQPIIKYLVPYSAALSIMAICGSYISYRLAKDDYRFAWFGIAGAIIMFVGILFYHGSIGQIVAVVLVASSSVAVLLFLFHAVSVHGRFILRNLIDFLDIFVPIPSLSLQTTANSSKTKRILIFNWRDTQHVFAGGAEVYVHEVAKRWVTEGNTVTLFCGNDGNAKRFETIDGINIIRRGGFYTVWLWAFLYYTFRLRGKFDVVVDNNSALPFFTPLYVKEPIVCIMHHVHQEIFKKYLIWPAAKLACFLEDTVTPFLYRNISFITVSNSTKQAMEKLGIGRAGITVVNPGVDLDALAPGEKDKDPLIVYVGRLNTYKSVNVLIKAFELLHLTKPKARLVIAGSGEEEQNLKSLAKKLKLDNVVAFMGRVEEDFKVWLMQRAWVFANPSSMEGWGITSIEANACGTPVVASNVPGLKDSVQNPHTGYLVEYGNPAAFAEKIDLLLSDPNQRKFMEKESLEWAAQFNWDAQAEKILNILLEKTSGTK